MRIFHYPVSLLLVLILDIGTAHSQALPDSFIQIFRRFDSTLTPMERLWLTKWDGSADTPLDSLWSGNWRDAFDTCFMVRYETDPDSVHPAFSDYHCGLGFHETVIRLYHMLITGRAPDISVLHGQSDSFIARNDRLYEIRRRAEYLDGFLIPKDLMESMHELDRLLSDSSKKIVKALPSRNDMIRYHHGLGMHLRNRWGLWTGSRLQAWMQARRITHPDDMSAVILEYYHDWLNGKPIDMH